MAHAVVVTLWRQTVECMFYPSKQYIDRGAVARVCSIINQSITQAAVHKIV